MRTLLQHITGCAIVALLFAPNIGFSQEAQLKEYSYSEFFSMIKAEPDSVFTLSNALIKVNPETDDDFIIRYTGNLYDSTYSTREDPIVINKEIRLSNVHFPSYFSRTGGIARREGLYNILFEKDVSFKNVYCISVEKSIFKKEFDFWNTPTVTETGEANYFDQYERAAIIVSDNNFYGRTKFNFVGQAYKDLTHVSIANNTIQADDPAEFFTWWFFNISSVDFTANRFKTPVFYVLAFEQLNQMRFVENSFDAGIPGISMIEVQELIFKDNQVNVPSLLEITIYNSLSTVATGQFNAPSSSLKGYQDFINDHYGNDIYINGHPIDAYSEYEASQKIRNEAYFNSEVEQKSEFYNYYKNKFNTKAANQYYSDIKTLETERIAYEHSLDPTFSTFFKLRINQFLKVFSNYGTEPERAVVVSLYVILCFALIYLFFPNSWDEHGRKRIMDRYAFFIRYMKKDAGIHEVYLEDRQAELMEYDTFRSLITSSRKQVPGFFIATGLPLYKWALSGTRFHAAFLRRVDIMKGAWQDQPLKKRTWKSILLISAFIIALMYDLLIKILNALMLSINTFTTLGFGEIPIKGLPRYLAIIQGFVGWFMLTIFSVSLISQLLN